MENGKYLALERTPSAGVNPGQPDTADISGIRCNRLETAITMLFGIAAIVLSFLYAYFSIFCLFVVYDDEGVMLVLLKFFFQGHALYDELYSCYQPFFFIFYRTIFKLWGVVLCHDNIRLLTIFLWVCCALVNAFIAYRLTSSRLLALAIMTVSMLCLRRFAFEPGHPQALAYLTVAATVLLCTFAERIPLHRLAFILGVLASFVLLIKINIGVFVMLPLGFALVAGSRQRGAGMLRIAIGLLMVLVPIFLMVRGLADIAWTAPAFCVVGLIAVLLFAPFLATWRSGSVFYGVIAVAICATCILPFAGSHSNGYRPFYFLSILALPISGALLIPEFYRPDTDFRLRHWLWALAGAVMSFLCVCLIIILMGTSVAGLFKGLIWMPFSQSKVFSYSCPMGMNGTFMALAGISSCCAYILARRKWADSKWFQKVVFLVVFGYGALSLTDFAWNMNIPIFGFLPLFWQLPFAWLIMVSPDLNQDVRNCFSRLALFAVAVMQPLIAYPIAGSQMCVATVLFSIIAAVCINDAIRMLPLEKIKISRSSPINLLSGAIAASAILLPLQSNVLQLGEYYATLTPLDLPGASKIRLSEERVLAYREIVARLARPEVGTFLCIPGLNSFYFWAEKEPPTCLITWMSLVDSRYQERIWEEASRHNGLMVVRNKEMIRFWVQDRPIDKLPIVQHIEKELKTVYSDSGYELMVRR